MFELVKAGGWLMLPIIICSILVVAICAERLWTLNPKKLAPPGLLKATWTWIQNGEMTMARIKALRRSSPLGEVMAAGLLSSAQGREVMKESIQEAASHVIHQMERNLSALGTIAAVAPLLGLLGTVIGMIKVFTNIMIQGTGNASVLAGGISEALITTASGMAIAIPALIMHRFFQRRIDGIVVEMEQQSIRLVDALHGDRKPSFLSEDN